MQNIYKTIRKLGEGSYGTVYLVEDSQGHQYALKEIPVNSFTKEESREQVQALKLMHHKNFIKIYQYLETQDCLSILTEFCEGQTIKNFCKEGSGKLDQAQIAKLIDQIIDAAIYMNEKGVIHRDIKPDNIMLTIKNGEPLVKICDFGCAKRSSIMVDISHSIESSFDKGTAIYTSPQQLESQKYSSKCDVWSMGCLLYELMFGEHPYISKTYEQMKKKMKESADSSIMKLPENTNLYLKVLLNSSLQYKEQQRASWKQIKLLRLFIQNSADQQQFLHYLKELSHMGEWIFMELWEARYEFNINKDLKKTLLYFLTGFMYSLYNMVKGILTKNPEFDYLGSLKPNTTNHLNYLRRIQNKYEQYLHIYEKIRDYICKNERLQYLLKKVPHKRNSTLSNLEYTRKYGLNVIKHLINHLDIKEIMKNSKLVYVLTKWVLFQKYFTVSNCFKVNDIKQGHIAENSVEWVKEQLGLQ